MRKIDHEGLEFIKRWEGKDGKAVLEAYKDGGGVLTIGFGHTKGVKAGASITEQEAEDFLMEDAEEAEEAVNSLVTKALNDHQFNALVSFTFNVGVHAFTNSSLLRYLNRGDFDSASKEFKKWCHDNGKKVQGLLNRRLAERDLFLS